MAGPQSRPRHCRAVLDFLGLSHSAFSAKPPLTPALAELASSSSWALGGCGRRARRAATEDAVPGILPRFEFVVSSADPLHRFALIKDLQGLYTQLDETSRHRPQTVPAATP